MKCAHCAAEFVCTADAACWCMDYPPAFKPDAAHECWCAACLLAATKNAPLIEGIDYVVEDGLWVFSKYFHLKRGDCCGNSCRNCPYDYVNVKFGA